MKNGWETLFLSPMLSAYRCLAAIILCRAILNIYAKYESYRDGWLSKKIDEMVQKIIKNEKREISRCIKVIIEFVITPIAMIETLLITSFKFFAKKIKRNLFLSCSFEVFDKAKIKICYDIKHWHNPSMTWVWPVAAVTAIFLSYFGILPVVDDAKSSNVPTIYSGLSAIVFALVIFVAGLIKDQSQKKRRKILRNSGLWPIALSTILLLFYTIFLQESQYFRYCILAIGVATILSFAKIISHIMDSKLASEDEIKFIKEDSENAVRHSIRQRIGNNILFEKIKEIDVEYTSKVWLEGDKFNHVFIEGFEEGRLTDINFYELKNLVSYLNNEAKSLGFSLHPKELKPAQSNIGSFPISSEFFDQEKVYLLRQYGEYLPPESIFAKDDRFILAIPKAFEQKKEVCNLVKDSMRNIFRFEKTETPSEELRNKIEETKDSLIEAIRSTSIGMVDKISKRYLDIAETFLEEMHKFGGRYSAEQAQKEQSNIFDSWYETRWLSHDIWELMEVAAGNKNRSVVGAIMYLPIAISVRAIKAKDHLLFQQFIKFSSTIYRLSRQADDSLKPFIIDRSWRYLKEISDLHIEYKLRNCSEEDIGDYEEFARYSIRIFQDLLKEIVDNKDFKTFDTVIDQFADLYEHEELSISKIKIAKGLVILSISSYLLEKLGNDQKDLELHAAFIKISELLPQNISELIELLYTAHDREQQNFYGWINWEIVADGKVHSIDVSGKFDRLFCVKSLQLLEKKNEDEVKRIILPHDGKCRGVSTAIIEILQNNLGQFNHILTAEQLSKSSILVSLLEESKERQKQEEEKYVANKSIDPAKLEEFKKKFKSSFSRSGGLRNLFSKFGIVNNLTNAISDIKIASFGYNQICEKAYFIKELHIHYVGSADSLGTGMANSEDQIAFGQIIDEISSQKIQKSNAAIKIEEEIQKLDEPIILWSLSYLTSQQELNFSKFINRYSEECPKTLANITGYQGAIQVGKKVAPVINVFLSNSEKYKNKIIVADLKKLAAWNQYSPLDEADQADCLYDIFMLKVSDLNEDKEAREKIIKSNPVWLQGYEDKELYLKQRVVLKLYQKFKIEILNKTQAICFDVEI